MSIFFHYLNETGGYINYGPEGLDRFDRLVSRCEDLGLKLVLPLFNYWPDYGGAPLYIATYSKTWTEQWIDLPKAQEVYRDYVKVIVERYKGSPAVFSWQLGNEPRCEGCGEEGMGRLVDWARNVSSYIKELDPDHMVSMGDEGWLTPREREEGYGDRGHGYDGINGVDWVSIMGIETLDYGTVHRKLIPILLFSWFLSGSLTLDSLAGSLGVSI
jgi:mannan endo-1,4-beta-mannosidase